MSYRDRKRKSNKPLTEDDMELFTAELPALSWTSDEKYQGYFEDRGFD